MGIILARCKRYPSRHTSQDQYGCSAVLNRFEAINAGHLDIQWTLVQADPTRTVRAAMAWPSIRPFGGEPVRGGSQWQACGGTASSAVAQPGCNAVDGEMNGALDPLVSVAGTMALQQRDLQVVERIDVGCAGLQAACESRVVLQK